MINRRLYTYIITNDDGKSPCYTDGVFSLACCKPQIRRMILQNKLKCAKLNAVPDEVWLAGIRRNKELKRAMVVFLARIDEILELGEYYDNLKYSHRGDCHYHNVHTIRINDNLPVSLDGKTIKKACQGIYASAENEHGKLTKSGKMTYEQCKDIYGASVLISNHFDHCNAYKDVWTLTDKLTPAFGHLLNDYMHGNRRHYHNYCEWESFCDVVKNVNLTNHKGLKGLDEISDMIEIKDYKKKNCRCNTCGGVR